MPGLRGGHGRQGTRAGRAACPRKRFVPGFLLKHLIQKQNYFPLGRVSCMAASTGLHKSRGSRAATALYTRAFCIAASGTSDMAHGMAAREVGAVAAPGGEVPVRSGFWALTIGSIG